MTDYLTAIERRANAATPGPWHRTGTDAKPHWYVSAPDVLVHGPALTREPDTVQQTVDRWTADADFIAHSRSDIPYLTARVRELEDGLRELRDMHEDGGTSQGYTSDGYGYFNHACVECGSFGEYGVEWPCEPHLIARAALRESDDEQT